MMLKRYLYWVPNLLTSANVLFGVCAILLALDNRIYESAWLSFFAVLFDAVDGRFARWIGHHSEFGKQYDSFADVISFGIFPIVLIYTAFHFETEKFPFLPLVIFVFCSIYRLVRYNLAINLPPSRRSGFSGLPIPASSGFFASFYIMYHDFNWIDLSNVWIQNIIIVSVLFISALMVSKLFYPNFKGGGLRFSFAVIFCLLALYLISSQGFSVILFILFVMYTLSGFFYLFIDKINSRNNSVE